MPHAPLQQLFDLFDQVMALPPAERRAELDALKAKGEPLVDQLESLVVFHDDDQPISTMLAPSLSDELFDVNDKRRQQQLADDLRQLASLLQWDKRTREFYLGSYRIRHCLSITTLGATYHAYDKQLDRDVALMLTYPRLTKNSQARLQLIESSRAVARVFHTNVASILGVVDFGEITGVLRQWVPGKSLAAWFQDRPVINLKQVATIGAAIAEGLDAIHQEFVLHGDLKPGNIILRHGELEPVITDFGTATWMLPGRKATWLGGTPGFLAPEILRGESPSVASDLYSLGVILYWLAMGRLPEQTGSQEDLLADLVAHESSHPDEANQRQHVAAVIAQLLQDRPEERPHHAREVVERLTSAAEIASPLVIPSMRPVFSKTQKSRRVWLAHAAGLALTCVGSFESVRRTGDWLYESSPQPFIPGGNEDLKLLARVAPKSIDAHSMIVALRNPNTPVKELDYWTAIGLPGSVMIGPKTANRWMELELMPVRLPEVAILTGTVLSYQLFNCPPGSATFSLDVRTAASHTWQNLVLSRNYFGGYHRRHREVAIPPNIMIPGKQLSFRIRMKSSVTADPYSNIPPVALVLSADRSNDSAAKVRLWLNPNLPLNKNHG